MGILGKVVDLRRKSVLRKRLGPTWGNFYFENGLWPSDGTSANADGSLNLPDCGVTIPSGNKGGMELVRAEPFLKGLRVDADAKFEIKGDQVFASIGDLRVRLDKRGDFVTLSELFSEGTYNFHDDGDFLFVDIGANVGFAALFFAYRFNGPVYSFELVPSTAAIARENIDLNPKYASRIELSEFGLADRNESMTINVNTEVTAGNSIYQQQGKKREVVELRDAAEVLKPILASKGGRKVVVKVDAEGAEYSIMRKWNESSLIAQMDFLLIEWHDGFGESVDSLREILKQNNFIWFERRHHEAPVGYIYAYKKPG